MSQDIVRHQVIGPRIAQSQHGPMVFGYIHQKDDTELFDDKIRKYIRKGNLPDLNAKEEYTIYRWKAGFMKHESVVLGCRGKFITLEIRVNGKITLYTTAEGINERSLEECAKIISTGIELFSKARMVYSNMSPYNFALNNCQDFVNQFLIEVGVNEKVKDTDTMWSLKTLGMVAGVVGLGLSLFLSKDKSKK